MSDDNNLLAKNNFDFTPTPVKTVPTGPNGKMMPGDNDPTVPYPFRTETKWPTTLVDPTNFPKNTITTFFDALAQEKPNSIQTAATAWGALNSQLNTLADDFSSSGKKLGGDWSSPTAQPAFLKQVGGSTYSLREWQNAAQTNSTALQTLHSAVLKAQDDIRSLYQKYEDEYKAAVRISAALQSYATTPSMPHERGPAMPPKYQPQYQQLKSLSPSDQSLMSDLGYGSWDHPANVPDASAGSGTDPSFKVLKKYTDLARDHIMTPLDLAYDAASGSLTSPALPWQGPKNAVVTPPVFANPGAMPSVPAGMGAAASQAAAARSAASAAGAQAALQANAQAAAARSALAQAQAARAGTSQAQAAAQQARRTAEQARQAAEQARNAVMSGMVGGAGLAGMRSAASSAKQELANAQNAANQMLSETGASQAAMAAQLGSMNSAIAAARASLEGGQAALSDQRAQLLNTVGQLESMQGGVGGATAMAGAGMLGAGGGQVDQGLKSALGGLNRTSPGTMMPPGGAGRSAMPALGGRNGAGGASANGLASAASKARLAGRNLLEPEGPGGVGGRSGTGAELELMGRNAASAISGEPNGPMSPGGGVPRALGGRAAEAQRTLRSSSAQLSEEQIRPLSLKELRGRIAALEAHPETEQTAASATRQGLAGRGMPVGSEAGRSTRRESEREPVYAGVGGTELFETEQSAGDGVIKRTKDKERVTEAGPVLGTVAGS